MANPLIRTRQLTLAVCATAACTFANAESYRFELSGGYVHYDADHSEGDGWSAAGRAYFSPVTPDEHPLAEAAFMQRASSFSLSHQRSDTTPTSYPEGSLESDTTLASLDYYGPRGLLFVGVNAARSKMDSGTYTDSDTRWSGSFGVTPVEGLLVSTDFYEGESLSDRRNLKARYLITAPDYGEAIALEADYRYAYGEKFALWSIDYYVDPTLSLGLTYSRATSFSDNGTTQIRAEKFLSPRISLSAYAAHNRREDNLGLELKTRL